jgi:hypothetical protein
MLAAWLQCMLGGCVPCWSQCGNWSHTYNKLHLLMSTRYRNWFTEKLGPAHLRRGSIAGERNRPQREASCAVNWTADYSHSYTRRRCCCCSAAPCVATPASRRRCRSKGSPPCWWMRPALWKRPSLMSLAYTCCGTSYHRCGRATH